MFQTSKKTLVKAFKYNCNYLNNDIGKNILSYK